MRRVFDVVVASLLLLLLSPVIGLIGTLILATMGRPVLFRQRRAGLHQRPFTIVKLRTMLDLTLPDGTTAPDEERMPRFGSFLRRSSLDELPSLWNVLRGHMSLVGPRPYPVEYLPRYSPEQRRRHHVRPGLTGLAQTSGRNSLSWEEKLALDVHYVDHRSLRMDLGILVKTVGTVLGGKGVSASGYATAPEFLGDEDRAD